MHRHLLHLLMASLMGATSAAAMAADNDFAAWHAALRATDASQALSDRYAAIWKTLDAAEKRRFSADERAWLNEGRAREVQACIERAGDRSEAVARNCDADAIEGRLGSLPAARGSVRSS